ncbi:PREDICTED: uncharacterized protein LOC108358199 isoform X2 [Rhagoletis zephyria]|uniref:uncharacterized protein LOC108358199 isoform X2 n=1 Tax=Rhagoletis zephyria TaxID=28612 RepID=UPI00081151A1|nr:PREDICTED: uncharacterized protein LOC108358199 isoform X2 [Rhagoletis zephyria]
MEKQSTQNNQLPANVPPIRQNEVPPKQPNECPCATKKPRYAEPRYISEISTPHLATSRHASRILKFVKNSFNKKTKLIKAFQDKARYLRKRVTKFEELMLHLPQKDLVNADAAEMMELIPENIKKMISRKLTGSKFYVNEISFALTLHFYSPKLTNMYDRHGKTCCQMFLL